ncbi:MAG: hypothetical protein RSD14_06355, partial [Clostridia bacterium]
MNYLEDAKKHINSYERFRTIVVLEIIVLFVFVMRGVKINNQFNISSNQVILNITVIIGINLICKRKKNTKQQVMNKIANEISCIKKIENRGLRFKVWFIENNISGSIIKISIICYNYEAKDFFNKRVDCICEELHSRFWSGFVRKNIH